MRERTKASRRARLLGSVPAGVFRRIASTWSNDFLVAAREVFARGAVLSTGAGRLFAGAAGDVAAGGLCAGAAFFAAVRFGAVALFLAAPFRAVGIGVAAFLSGAFLATVFFTAALRGGRAGLTLPKPLWLVIHNATFNCPISIQAVSGVIETGNMP